MRSKRTTIRALTCLALAIWLFTSPLAAEQGILALTVMDLRYHAIQDVQIGIEGVGGSPQLSDPNGKMRLRLAPDTKEGTLVTLMFSQSLEGMGLVLITPYDRRVRVPPFETQSEYALVYLARRSDIEILQTGAGLLALHATINRSVAARRGGRRGAVVSQQDDKAVAARLKATLIEAAFSENRQAKQESPGEDKEFYKAALAEAAMKFGFTPQEIEAAFHSWGGDPLTWKIVDLSGLLDTGGSNPFETVSSWGWGKIHDVSFGVAALSLRLCTLQRLLLSFQAIDSGRFDSIAGQDRKWLIDSLHASCPAFYKRAEAKMLDASGELIEPWKSRLIAFAREPSVQRGEVEQLVPLVQRAQLRASELNLTSERAVAFLYDLAGQTDEPLDRVYHDYAADTAAFAATIGRQPDEVERLLYLANRASYRPFSPATPFLEPLRARIIMIALGGGSIGGREYDLDPLGIGLRSYATGEEIPLHNDRAILEKLKSGWLPAGNIL
jgi:hypothetical protein